MDTNRPESRRLSSEELFFFTEALRGLGYPDPQPHRLASGLKDVSWRRCAKGETVIREGDEYDFVYILHSGVMAVTKRDAGGRPEPVVELERGALFGEMALLLGRLRGASVTAATDCDLFVINPPDFRWLLGSSPVFKCRVEALAEARAGSFSPPCPTAGLGAGADVTFL